MNATCNFCEYLEKDYTNPDDTRFFNARCSKCSIETTSVKRGRTIEYHTFNRDEIERPTWCPKFTKNEESEQGDFGHSGSFFIISHRRSLFLGA